MSFSREKFRSTGHSEEDIPTIRIHNLENIFSSSLQERERHKSKVWAALCFQMWSSVLLSKSQFEKDAGTNDEFNHLGLYQNIWVKSLPYPRFFIPVGKCYKIKSMGNLL